ncbi:MAG TPA: DUF3889 domain-containing protein [Bacillus sp. (in: firmicutes)]|uniref:DUF3889 domain-containing protein n=1 Tax=Bacillus litorisediminis TaxID=2922713 RepID=UPI001FAD16CA|nr:DUF3889 domain-containing protein [Bacillus litorisediminis]HWO78301.1 DUF3889 domain-containing protein [Bacillus sp. (in: firmicutes)]
MKKFLSCIILISFLFSAVGHQQAEGQVDYEKYGRVAIALVKEDYPGAPVQEYQYLGRKRVNENRVQDSFEFRVTESGRPKRVVVLVTHDPRNKKILDISVQEAR